MEHPMLVSIQVGMPETFAERAATGRRKTWTSAIYKHAVEGPVWLGYTNLAGDGQADLRAHGGPDRALLAYSADHYDFWRRQFPHNDLPHGSFGENFTISGLTEDTVCVDDVYAIGEVQVQVTMPRGPCWKITKRTGIKDMETHVRNTGLSGWYMRVLFEGIVQAGLAVTLLERPNPEMTVSRMIKETA